MSLRSKEHSRIRFNYFAGVTLVELMVTLAVVAISLTLAVPAYNNFREKRNIRKTSEEITSFINYAQSAAVKANQKVRVSWNWQWLGADWEFCLGATDDASITEVDNATCNCWTENACTVDEKQLKMYVTDPVIWPWEFGGHFTFDPIRGGTIFDDPVYYSSTNIYNNSWLFYMWSGDIQSVLDGKTPQFAVRMRLNATGRLDSCQISSHPSLAGGLPSC